MTNAVSDEFGIFIDYEHEQLVLERHDLEKDEVQKFVLRKGEIAYALEAAMALLKSLG